MEPKAIVYTSNTGYTAQYAALLAKKTGLRAYAMNEAMEKVLEGSRVCHLRNAQPQARQGLGVFYGIIFCTYKSEYGGRSFEGTEVSTREELVGNGDAESPENQGKVIRTGVEDAVIVARQPVYLPTV